MIDMDKRIVLTKRQKELIQELRKNLKRLSEMNVGMLANSDDMGQLILAFYNDEEVHYCSEDDEYIDDPEDDYSSCIIDPNELSNVIFPLEFYDTPPVLLLENNQYVKDRIIEEYKQIQEEREEIAFQEALAQVLGEDAIRLHTMNAEIERRDELDKVLHEELDRWVNSGNEKMIEITSEDIAVNDAHRTSLKSEAMKLGLIVAEKKREFLKNRGE